jgi:sugar/nucleoside kinase (ribokinase family)
MSQFDILSIGDVVTDAFIKLFDEDAQVISDGKDGKLLAMPFATKLPFDHSEVIPAVGNAANAAVAFARLGLKTGFVANVGNDAQGREIIAALEHNDVDSGFIRINRGKMSNYHYVLWYKEERTILIKHEEYDYHWPHFTKKEIPRWVYFSSISKNALDYHDDVVEWLEDNPMVHLAFQPGTFQMAAGTKRLKRIYERSSILLLNREEAVKVGGGDYDNINELLDKLHELGPQVIVMTDGPKGAYASDGMKRMFMPPYPDPAPPFERTGAGDAFSSTFVAAAAKGLSLEEALRWAPINSMSVVQKVGGQAGLLTEKELQNHLHHAPKDYKAKLL